MNFQLLRAGTPHPHIVQRPTVMQNDKSGITSLKSNTEGRIKTNFTLTNIKDSSIKP